MADGVNYRKRAALDPQNVGSPVFVYIGDTNPMACKLRTHYQHVEDDRLIGGLWANLSEGRCRFVMVKDKRWDLIEPLLVSE